MVPFYNLVSKLNELDFEVAIAIPSIANEFSLTVKINSKSQSYKDEEEIKFVINVLRICFEEASPSELVFWQAYGELKDINVKLTKDNLIDFNLNSVIKLLKTNCIIIKENPIEMQTLLEKKDDNWRFFLPLDGADTVIEAIRTMNLLKESNNNTFNSVEWVVGFLGVNQYNSAPLLFLIKNAAIHLVITDFVDTLILTNGVRKDKLTEIDFKIKFDGLLTIDSLNQTFCKDKANYAIDLYNKLNILEKQMQSFEKLPFRNSADKKVIDDALNNIRSFLNKTNHDEKSLKDSLDKIQLREHKKFAAKRYYFSVIEKLKKSFYNDNYHKLKSKLDTLQSIGNIRKSTDIGELISKFNKTEIEYLTSNKRFVFIFGSDQINQIKSKKQSKIETSLFIYPLVFVLSNMFFHSLESLSELDIQITKNFLEYILEDKSGKYKNIVEVMKKENNISAKDNRNDGESALHIGMSSIFLFIFLFIYFYSIAASEGHTATCQFLIDKGSEVNVKDNDGWTPLHYGEY